MGEDSHDLYGIMLVLESAATSSNAFCMSALLIKKVWTFSSSPLNTRIMETTVIVVLVHVLTFVVVDAFL
jgi:hypothetical protein